MFLIVYCDAADYDVFAALKKAGFRSYTKMEGVRGEGTDTEPKLGTHCWPGKNNVVFIGVQDPDMPRIMEVVRHLRQEHPRAGVKGFVLPMEEVI